jgi:hypothetical protein
MNQLRVKPDKDGRLFITLFGTKYEIIVEKEEEKKPKKEDK